MGFFRNNTKRILQEFRAKSEFYSNDLGKEINEAYDDLKSDYEEYSNVVPQFLEFISVLKLRLNETDAQALEDFSLGLKKLNRCAKNGVEAMRELSYNQRKLTTETLRHYEEFE